MFEDASTPRRTWFLSFTPIGLIAASDTEYFFAPSARAWGQIVSPQFADVAYAWPRSSWYTPKTGKVMLAIVVEVGVPMTRGRTNGTHGSLRLPQVTRMAQLQKKLRGAC